AFRAAADLLDELRPDVVHVQAHFLVGRGLVRAAVARGIPVIATNHFMPENLYGHARIPGWLRFAAARLGWADLRRVFRDAHVWHHVAASSLDIRVEIVGDGSRRAAWQELARQLGIAGRVVFHGFVGEGALLDAYTRCDVFCMPGVAELQSLATMEAMAAGKP